MLEKRGISRTRTVLGARAVFNGGLTSVECNIRDLHKGGARLAIDRVTLLPERFVLEIPRKNLSYRAMVRWRDDHFVGVQFEEAPQQTGDTDVSARVQKLEEENAILRRRIADMAKRLDSYGDSESPLY